MLASITSSEEQVISESLKSDSWSKIPSKILRWVWARLFDLNNRIERENYFHFQNYFQFQNLWCYSDKNTYRITSKISMLNQLATSKTLFTLLDIDLLNQCSWGVNSRFGKLIFYKKRWKLFLKPKIPCWRTKM